MKHLIHFPTCAVWDSGEGRDCDCFYDCGWVIRKDSSLSFHPWRIFRQTFDGDLIPLMGAASFRAAVQIVNALQSLRIQYVQGDRHVR